ncbi:hypothetical protein BC828DRAFT_216047 [Blastocladiella britannica]|nr:hypothetical protein BC828DRAFT_216047 [Blastocladiella britannica]
MDLSTTIASLLPPAVPRDNHLIPLPTRRLVTKPLPPWKTPSSADLPLPVPCPRPPPRRLYSPLNATLLPAADDPVLRHLPDPTTEAKGAGGLSESHCQKFYVHGTADPDWTRAAQSGFPGSLYFFFYRFALPTPRLIIHSNQTWSHERSLRMPPQTPSPARLLKWPRPRHRH